MKKVLVTGSLGFIGSVLTPYLRKSGYSVTGYDTGFFKDCGFEPIQDVETVVKDVRLLEKKDLQGCDAVVQLAGISNDPFGNLRPDKVYDPTRVYTLRLAKMCKELGIKFIFASSCSIYGKGAAGLLNEDSEVFPQTAYSLNKLQVEQDMATIADRNFTPICLRFATAYGYSPRLRFDLFLNMMVGMAVTTRQVVLNSDGTAWRPSVHVEDICKSVRFAIESDQNIGKPLILNVGTTAENHQIREIAEMIVKRVPRCELVYLKDVKHKQDAEFTELIKDRKLQDHVDSRTYKISFERIRQVFKGFECDWTVEKGVSALVDVFEKTGLDDGKFKDFKFYRLQKIDQLYRAGKLTDDLFWKSPA